MADQRERLQRLAEPHVVSEDPAELELPQRRQPAEPVTLVGAQLCVKRRRRLVLGDRVDLEQRADLALPRLRLLGHDAERGELGPEPGLIAADPQRRRGRVRQRSGLFDQRSQLLQARLQQREVSAVIEQHVRLAAREGAEHLGERQLAAVDADRHPEIEPVALSRDIGGGKADRQRVADIAVVRGLSGDLHGHVCQLRQPRQHLRREVHAVEARERDRDSVLTGRSPSDVEQAEALEARPGEVCSRKNRALGVEVAKPGTGPVTEERRVPCGVADLVGPLPSDLDIVAGAVAGAQHQRRRGDLRRRERVVRGHHRGDVVQGGIYLLGEVLELACRDLQPLAPQDHPLQRRRRRLEETHERQPPVLGSLGEVVALGDLSGDVTALRAHHPVPAGTKEQQRLQTVRVLTVDSEDATDVRRPIAPRDVDEQLAPLVAAHLAEPGACVDESQPDAGRLLQQRPQLHAVAITEIERLVGAVAVAVVGGAGGIPIFARAVDGVQLANQRQVIGAVLAALDMPRVQPVPAQRAVDPAAAGACSHQLRHQPRPAAIRGADRVQRQLDRQRVASRRPCRRRIDQRAQGLLPRRWLYRRRDS